MSFWCSIPISFERLPTTKGLLQHLQLMYNHLICAILRNLPTTNIPSHRNVEYELPLFQSPCPTRYLCLHHSLAVDIPHQPSPFCAIARIRLFLKRNTECDTIWSIELWY